MKDQYTGDINDYRKYGLLRVIQRETGMRLGINWLKTPDDGRMDGEFRNYLKQPQKFRKYDPQLFDALSLKITTKEDRKISTIVSSGILGNALSFDSIVPDDEVGRKNYQQKSLQALSTAEIIFFDPDNGIEVKSVRYGRKDSSKFVYLQELIDYYKRGQSLLIYQHFPRVKRDFFISESVNKLRSALNCKTVLSFSSSHVVFLFVGTVRVETLQGKIQKTLISDWGNQFDVTI